MKTKKILWGVQVGMPTKLHPFYQDALVNPYGKGRWMSISFDTRKEARAQAKAYAKFNRFWNFHPKKRP